MIFQFPWQKKISDADVLVLALDILFERAGTFNSVEEMKAFLSKDAARPQDEHDAEIRAALEEARRQLEGII